MYVNKKARGFCNKIMKIKKKFTKIKFNLKKYIKKIYIEISLFLLKKNRVNK